MSLKLSQIWNPHILNDLEPDAPSSIPSETIEEKIQRLLIEDRIARMQERNGADLLGSDLSTIVFPSPDAEEDRTPSLPSLPSSPSLFSSPTRRRRSSAPATAALLDKRQLLTAAPTVPVDTANWGSPSNGAQAEMQVVANKITYDLALSPDGGQIATANGDASIHMLNGATGAHERILTGHTALLTTVDYSPDGQHLASTGYDKTVKIWNTNTGVLERSISLPNLGTGLAWSPDGTMLAVSVIEQPLRLYIAGTGALLRTFPTAGDACMFSFSTNGSSLTISQGSTLKTFTVATGAVETTLTGLSAEIYAEASNAEGTLVIAGDNGGQAAIWNATTGTKLWQQGGHGPVRSVAFSPDMRHVIVGGEGGKILVYDATQLLTTGVMTPVREYTSPRQPRSIIVSPSNHSFVLTTADTSANSRTMVFDLPDPPAIPDPEPEPEPEVTIAETITSALEGETPLPAKTFTTVAEALTGDARSEFTVRFRNPRDATYILVRTTAGNGNAIGWNETITHTGGTTDSSYTFSMYPQTNGGGKTICITLFADSERTQVLDVINCYYNYDTNRGAVTTAQRPWEDVEEGLLSPSPIVPEMKMVKTNGPTVLLSVASPHDQSVVTFTDAWGRLTSQELLHEGGTAFSTARLTFTAARNTGNYTIQLQDRYEGRPLDTIVVHWDKATNTLTSVDAADQLTSEQVAQVDTSSFNALMALTTADLDDAQLNWIQQMRVYEMTKDFEGSLKFYINGGEDLMARIFAVHPEYMEANWEEGIDALWGQIGHSFYRSQAKDMFHHNRLDYIHTMTEALEKYEATMGVIMQQAVNFYMQIAHGADERTLEMHLTDLIAAEQNKGGYIRTLPSMEQVMQAAKLVYERGWREMNQRQADLVKFREASDRMRELGLRQTATGEWVAVSPAVPVDLPPTMSHREISLAAKIRRTLLSSNDPRVVALSPARRDALALHMAAVMPDQATLEDISEIQTIAMADVESDNPIEGYQINLQDTSYSAATQFLSQLTQQECFNIAFNMSDFYQLLNIPNSANALSPFLPIVRSTIAGKLFAETSEALFDAPNTETALKIALILESVTGIKASEYMQAKKYSSPRVFARVFSSIITKNKFTDLSTQPLQVVAATMLSAIIHYPEESNSFTDTNIVPISLNALTQNVAITSIKAYSDGMLLAQSAGALFINVPMNRSGDGLTITLHVTLADGRTMNIQTQKFNMRLTQIGQHLSASNDPIENAILDQMATMESFVVRGAGWRRTISSDYHLGDGLFAIDLNKGEAASDDNEAVYCPAEGYVDSITFEPGSGKSTLIIRHKTVINGQDVVWYTKYLHMDKMGTFDTNGAVISSFTKDDYIHAGQRIGEVGDIGAPGQVHLHFEILRSDETLIDGRKLIEHNGMQTKAWDGIAGGELLVEWDSQLNAWKGSEAKNAGLVFVTDANSYTNGATNVWVAWDSDPAKRGVVRWETITYVDENGIVQTNKEAWVDVATHTKRWNGFSFISI